MPFSTSQPRSDDGRFAQKAGTAPEAELFWVEDAGGDGSDIVGGERTDEAEWLFRNGQCLALASELAEALGSDRVIVVLDEFESEDALWDEETDSPVLDEDGQIVMETTVSIHHAYALSNDGETAYDIDGPIERSRILEGERGTEELSVEDAQLRFSGFMSEQNYEFAKTFIPSVLR